MDIPFYQYQPLHFEESIRLVHIHPAKSKSARLVCDIRHADTASRYEALSYTWGNPELSHNVVVEELESQVRITASLHDALVNLRQPDSVRVIWADGICIQQSDISELNYQVQLMARIYRHAQRVVVWLGSDNSVAEYGFALLQCVSECRKRSRTVGTIMKKLLQPGIEETSTLQVYSMPSNWSNSLP